ncbi:MAG: LysM peptidoglycan-binding domain-containing protein [Bacteriovoracia bacterium]
MKLTPWLVLLSLVLVSCSGSKSAQKVDEETPQIELSDADEFIDTPTDEQPAGDAVVDETAPAEVVDDGVISTAEPLVQDSTLENVTPVISNDAGSIKQYTVQKNETLMMIAFKIYGDYARWKDLASQNREKLKGGTTVATGMTLDYAAPAEEFVWNPQGNPYLIRTGDTLGGISTTVYNTTKKWKLLWENNKPLIKDPNKIFAGFTIYYPESGREVANEI